jgi:copper chaperone CopZ
MTRLLRSATLAAAIAAIPSIAAAELRRVEFKLEGMDCAYCNGAMGTAVGKVDGVESLELSPGRGVAIIRLKPENTVTLKELRRVIKSVGYEPRAADITATGRIVAGAAGAPSFDLLNGSILPLAGDSRQPADAIVEISGVSKTDDQGAERLTIATIK